MMHNLAEKLPYSTPSLRDPTLLMSYGDERCVPPPRAGRARLGCSIGSARSAYLSTLYSPGFLVLW